ncbi:PKD domain-containing protein [Candidatus Woesearchaeota archaeon]|nr:PKD domain-containing protein [Candidatus Woesearchaeota archaeon]
MNRIISFIIIFTLFFASPVLASIDLVTPLADAATNDQNATFEYYPSIQGIERCTLDLEGEEFLDVTIDNEEFNTFTVVNIAPGNYDWSVSCENSTATEQSGQRTLLIDWTPPELTIIEPVENATIEGSIIKVTASDDNDDEVACSAYHGATFLASFTIEDGGLKNVDLGLGTGTYTITVTCFDEATNGAIKQHTFTVVEPIPNLFLELSTNKQLYSLGESIALTIDTLNEASVSIEVCPDTQGFVKCFTPLIDDGFPQTVVLPYTNSTGTYLIDGTAALGDQTVYYTITYTVENTMTVAIASDVAPAYNREITLTATANGALGEVTYVWTLHDDTEVNGSKIDITYSDAGSYTETVVATDESGNSVEAQFTATIETVYDIEVHVKDATTNEVLGGATVQFEDTEDHSFTADTDTNGKTYFSLEKGDYDLFVSKIGYEYNLQEVKLDKQQTFVISLTSTGQYKPLVTIVSPGPDATTSIPTIISFTVNHDQETVCTLSYISEGSQWLEQSGIVTVPADGEGAFDLTALEEKTYRFKIGCEDAQGFLGESEERSFTVDEDAEDETELVTDAWGNDPLDIIDRAYGAYDSFNADQRTLADLLSWEDSVKQQKRAIERALRDRDAVRFRNDLTDAEKQTKTKEFDRTITEAQQTTPFDLAVLEKKKRVENLNSADIAAIVESIIESKEYTLTAKQAQGWLDELQQGFTKETTVFRGKILMADGTERDISLITYTFTYKNPDALEDHTLYELIPEQMAADAKSVITLNKHVVTKTQPPVLEFQPEKTITYYVEVDVPISTLLGAQTVLLKKLTVSDMEEVTGKAFLSNSTRFDWKLSLALTILLTILIAAARRFDAVRHFKYLFYAESKKKSLHAIQTIINDGHSHLDAGDLERAMMRYKEAKLSYEHLSAYAQNEVLPDILRLHEFLDDAYFRKLLNRIGEAIDAGRMADAIEDYARLEGTFEHLPAEKQNDLIMVVNEISRKLHLGGDAA